MDLKSTAKQLTTTGLRVSVSEEIVFLYKTHQVLARGEAQMLQSYDQIIKQKRDINVLHAELTHPSEHITWATG